jgi:soluble lytic murein transglycosylase-like protein
MFARRGVLAVALLLAAAPAAAEVRVEVRADGLQVIRNEPAAARERRLAGRLLPFPSQRLAELAERRAAEQALDPRLVQAVMQVESGFNPRALSTKGAIGLMQLMPETARDLAVADPWDPEQNVDGGTRYLRRMLDHFSGDLTFALAAYNAGPNAVLRHAGVPPFPETRAYVSKVLCLYEGDCGGEERVGRRVALERDADGLLRITTGPGG